MRITNLMELRAWAETNCAEKYCRLPAAGSYETTSVGSCVSIYVGTIARTEVHCDFVSFENNRLKVQAHLEPGKTMPVLVAGKFTRLAPSYYDKIELSEPFCCIWPGMNDSIGLAKFNALVRYTFMVRGHCGGLCDMPFGIHEVFPQLCADIARGQSVKIMKTTWEEGERYGQGSMGGGGERTDKVETEGSSANTDVCDEQQNSRNVFENRVKYLCEEFRAYTSTLRADYEGFVEGQAQYGSVVKGLQKEVKVAECRVRTLEAKIQEAKAGEQIWKHKFESCRASCVAPWTTWRKISREKKLLKEPHNCTG